MQTLLSEETGIALPGVVAYGFVQVAEYYYGWKWYDASGCLLHRVYDMKDEVERFGIPGNDHAFALNHTAYVDALLLATTLAERLGDYALAEKTLKRGQSWAMDGGLAYARTGRQLDEFLRIEKKRLGIRKSWMSVGNYIRNVFK